MSAHDKPSTAVKTVTCPTCKGDAIYAPSNPYRPFCSERCKLNDFGAWASESFRIPAEEQDELERRDTPLQ